MKQNEQIVIRTEDDIVEIWQKYGDLFKCIGSKTMDELKGMFGDIGSG